MKKTDQSPRAFTLIELLVVVAIIAILAGIALPVFSRVQERARAIEDANNLRQLGIAMVAYINDNDDYAPDASSWAEDESGGGTDTDGLYPNYVESFEVFKSPFDGRPEGGTTDFPISYGMNSNITGTDTNTAKWETTSNLVLLVPNPDTANEGNVSWDDEDSLTVSSGGIADNGGTHAKGRRINVLFGDSHVEDVTVATLRSGEANQPPYWNPGDSD